ncbi:phage holin, LLH family [Enterococcus sp. AZ109]|uniref:phage holin, LLH family n=1 Tax=Enterococcus sp. AZ109 TaxID=2774634 RepID=UPI003F22B7CB
MQDIIVQYLTAGFLAGVFWLVVNGIRFVNKELIWTDLRNKQQYADVVVKAAQQMYQLAGGPVKFQKAKTQLIDYLNKKNIKYTEAELEMLIEAAVKTMKEAAKEATKEEL